MRQIITVFALLISQLSIGQGLKNLSFGNSSSFELITWNIEWFPKNQTITPDSVAIILQALDADLYAIQEIADSALFRQIVDKIPGYKLSMHHGNFGGLVYVYKESTIQFQRAYQIYTNSTYRQALPRAPYVFECQFNGEDFIIINNHFKCCGDGMMDRGNPNDQETRRLAAIGFIKGYIDNNFSEKNAILTGDLNDLITDPKAHNVFSEFIDDTAHYVFADMAIAESNSSEWSYPNWPSHLDHILISDELFEEFQLNSTRIETIKPEEFMAGGFNEYDNKITDHRPVGMQIKLGTSTSVFKTTETSVELFPNPMQNELNIIWPESPVHGLVQIFDLNGRLVFKKQVSQQSTKSSLTLDPQLNGIYHILLLSNNQLIHQSKLIISDY